MNEKVVPLRVVATPVPLASFEIRFDMMPDGTVVAVPDQNVTPDYGVLGDLLLRATYNVHQHHRNGFMAVVMTADETNVYFHPGVPRTAATRAMLRDRFDNLYHRMTGRFRNPLHWLRQKRKPYAHRKH